MHATTSWRQGSLNIHTWYLRFLLCFLAAPKVAAAPARPAKKEEDEEEDDDDFDMFGSDDEVDEEAERIKVSRDNHLT